MIRRVRTHVRFALVAAVALVGMGPFASNVARAQQVADFTPGGIKIGPNTAACGSTYAGSIRYVSGLLQYCDTSQWETISSAGASGVTAAGSTGSVQFNSGGTLGADNTNFWWDNTNKRLGIGTNSPQAPFWTHLATNQNLGVRLYGLITQLYAASDTNSGYSTMAIDASQLYLDANFGSAIGIGTTAPLAALDVQLGNTAASGAAYGTRLKQTLTGAANGDALYGLFINPTYSSGFTYTSADIGFGGAANRIIAVASNGASAGKNLTVQAGSTTGGTNINGGNLILSSGQSTGTGNSAIQFLGAGYGTSGTGSNAPAEVGRVTGGGFVQFKGAYNTGDTMLAATGTATPGAGTRMVWYPNKAAIRAGIVQGTEWDDSNIGNYSTAFGQYNTASGAASTALGDGNTASASLATAWGIGNTADGQDGTAWGANSVAGANVATAWGNYATATGDFSTAFGQYVMAGTGIAPAGGRSGDNKGNYSLAIGLTNTSTTPYASVTGLGSFGVFMQDQHGEVLSANNVMALEGGQLLVDPSTGAGATVSTVYTALQVNGTIRVGNGNEVCGSNYAGAIRYYNATLQYCDTSNWDTISSSGAGGVTAAGSSTQVQFNSGGVLGASANFTWNGTVLSASNYNVPSAGAYQIGSTNILTYPYAGADTSGLAIGANALTGQTATTLANIALGSNAGRYISTGSYNLAVGYDAMLGISGTPLSGGTNTAVGENALYTIQGVATQNTAVGEHALYSNTTAAANTAVGQSALQNDSIGASNTAVGQGAAYLLGTGSNEVAIGYEALYTNYGTSGSTAVGTLSLGNATNGPNTALGYYSGLFVTSGTGNTAIGFQALEGTSGNHLTGTNSTALGDSALQNLSGAASNDTGLGYHAGNTLQTGTDNTLVGYTAGGSVTGNSNIILGENGVITSGSTNILIGNSLSTGLTATASNQLDIGGLIYGTIGSAKVSIGTSTITTALNVGGTLQVANGNEACGSTYAGAIRFYSATIQYCDGGTWDTLSSSGGGGTPAGSNTYVQYNSGGAFGANSGFTWNGTVLTASNVNVPVAGAYQIGGLNAISVPAADTVNSLAIGTAVLPSDVHTTGITGQNNIGIGYYAMNANTSGGDNLAVGPIALEYATTGSYNTAIGQNAMTGVSGTPLTGSSNTAVGEGAVALLQGAASSNAAFGQAAGAAMTSGSYNIAFGVRALQAISTASNATAVGYGALYYDTGGNATAIGYNAGYNVSTGTYNTAIGYNAMYGVSGTKLTGNNNIAVGDNALYTIQGAATQNTAIGPNALYSESATSGADTGIGYNAGKFISTGIGNTVIGNLAAQGITATPLTGNYNTTIGDSSGLVLQGAGANNTLIGYQSGKAITSGTDNTLVGYDAGQLVTGNTNIIIGEGGNITTGGSNVVIGNSLTGTSATGSNQLDIAGLIYGTIGSNKVGISTSTLTTALNVGGSVQVGNGGETCSSTYGGAIRFISAALQYCDGSSTWQVVSTGGGGSTALSSLTASTAINSFDNAAYAQTWSWNSMTSGNAFSLSSSSMTSGNVFSVQMTNTSNTGSAINGANSSTSGINYGVLGTIVSTSSDAAAVEGADNATTGTSTGVLGFTNSTGGADGVGGYQYGTSNTGDGVYAYNPSVNGHAVESNGALLIDPPNLSEASAATLNYATATVTSPTITLTGSTNVTGFVNNFHISAPTFSVPNGVTVSNAATVNIDGPPILTGAGALSGIAGLYIGAGAVGSATNAYGLYVSAPTGATNNYAAVFPTGNVGIGNTSPSQMLTIGSGGAGSTPEQAIRILENGYANPTADNTNSTGDKLVMWNVSGIKSAIGTDAYGMTLQASGGSNSHIGFWTGATAGTAPTEAMRLISSGYFGIGTIAPYTRLQVAGSVMVGNGGETCGSNYGGAIRWTGAQMQYCDGSSTWQVVGSGGGATPAGSTGDIQFNSGGALGADNTNLFWDNTNKRVGIGNVAPAATLDVTGQMYSRAYATASLAVDWSKGNVQTITLSNGAATATFTNGQAGGRYILVIKQPASGAAGTITWPGTVSWPGATGPTLTTTNGKVDIITFLYANSLYYAIGLAQNY